MDRSLTVNNSLGRKCRENGSFRAPRLPRDGWQRKTRLQCGPGHAPLAGQNKLLVIRTEREIAAENRGP